MSDSAGLIQLNIKKKKPAWCLRDISDYMAQIDIRPWVLLLPFYQAMHKGVAG